MHFLYPAYLWALPVLIIPVVVHLFNLQRTEKVVFANTRMLENLVKETSKARNLRHLLLLLLRLLALACLILAFAQPVFSKKDEALSAGEMNAVAVYADDSPGMLMREDGENALGKALAYASSIPAIFEEKGWFRLFTNESKTGTGWTSASGFRDQVLDIRKSPSQKKLSTVLNQAYRQFSLRNGREKRHLYIISDFQRSFLEGFRPAQLDSGVIHHFIPVAHNGGSNIWIDSAWLAARAAGQEKAEIQFRVRASGLQEKRVSRVQLYEGSSLQAGKQFEILPGKDFITSLPLTMKSDKLRKMRLETEDPLVPWDNNFFIVLKAPQAMKVHRLGDKANPVLAHLFQSSSSFLYRESPMQNPAYDALEKCDLLILDKPATIGEGLSSRITAMLDAGKTICLIPDQNFARSQQPGGKLPLPEGLFPSPEGAKIMLPGADNSFFQNTFTDPGKNPLLPDASLKFNLAEQGFPVLRTQNGNTFLSRNSIGNGSFFVFASDPSDVNFSFHRHPLMLASFFRMAAMSMKETAGLLYAPKNQTEVFLSPDSGFVPGEGMAELRNADARVQAGIGKSGENCFVQADCAHLEEGFWDVSQNGKVIDAFAVNRNQKESELDFISGEELKGIFPSAPWIKIAPVGKDAGQEHLKAGLEQGSAPWKWLLLAGIGFLLAEAFLGRKINRSASSI